MAFHSSCSHRGKSCRCIWDYPNELVFAHRIHGPLGLVKEGLLDLWPRRRQEPAELCARVQDPDERERHVEADQVELGSPLKGK